MARRFSTDLQATGFAIDHCQAMKRRSLDVRREKRIANGVDLLRGRSDTPFVLCFAEDGRRDAGLPRQFALAHAAASA